jgi:2-dehydro-3-deoxyphosphogluconate aldolase / (4S)-4-hydroxy-2-oxoglutarate aldolase
MLAKLNAALKSALARITVVPVLTIDRLEDAVALGRALADGGLTALEITLRTPTALKAIEAMARELPHAMIGAGTILQPDQARDAINAGARFLVSPGITPNLMVAAQAWKVPYLPGVATVSEAMALADMGLSFVKFFPAEPAGGAAFLKAIGAPVPNVSFCPTGGIGPANVRDYLALPNVVCVGGSWIVPSKAVAARDWPTITRLAKDASVLRGVSR